MNLFYGSIRIMGADNMAMNSFPTCLKRLKYRWLPNVRISVPEVGGQCAPQNSSHQSPSHQPTPQPTPQTNALHYEILDSDGWHAVAPETLPSSSPFSKAVLLLPDAMCSFRCLEFPLDMVAAKDLDEAIALDVEKWNPFGSDIALLSFYERVEEHWQVAVWVWPKDEESKFVQRLADSVRCTHIMPTMAWYAARVQEKHHVLLVHSLAAESAVTYAMVSPVGVPRVLSCIRDKGDAKRFWRALGDQAQLVGQAFLCDVDGAERLLGGVSERSASERSASERSASERSANACFTDVIDIDIQALKPGSARLALFNRARLKGVEDWSDPLRWRKPILALLSLLILWVVADVAVLTHRSEAVGDLLGNAEREAAGVLSYRDQVDGMQLHLQDYTRLRAAQHQPERLLAALSEHIPSDIWLNTLQSGPGWMDIHGQGKHVVRLVVLLEKIEMVKKVMILSDIRADTRTGLEAFHLRLVLNHEG